MSNLCCTVYGAMCFVWQCNVLCSHLYYLCPKLIFFCIYVLIIRRVSQLRPRCNPIPGKVTQRLAPTGSRAGDPTSPPGVTRAGSLFWSGSLYVLGGEYRLSVGGDLSTPVWVADRARYVASLSMGVPCGCHNTFTVSCTLCTVFTSGGCVSKHGYLLCIYILLLTGHQGSSPYSFLWDHRFRSL